MKSQTLILLVIAAACGLIAMLGVKQYLAKQNQIEEVPKVQVLVASAPIKPGDALSELNTQFVTVEAATCPEGVVTDLEQITERSIKTPRGPGDWIMVDQLTAEGQLGAVTGIPKGMRVSTIPVDATTHHSGMLQPGNRIDLFLTYRDRDRATGIQSEKIIPLLEYIEVFAVDNVVYGVSSGGENIQARNISLLVTPEQMMKLQLAKKKGDITTSLRSSEDMESIDIAELTEDNLYSPHGEIDTTSTLDVRNEFKVEGFALPEEDDDTDVRSLLAAELTAPAASGPVEDNTEDAGQFWTMAIYESGGVRVEKVNLLSDEPIDTRGPAPGKASPLTSRTQKNGAADPVSDPVSGAIPGLDDLDMEDSGTLEEAASGLLELFN